MTLTNRLVSIFPPSMAETLIIAKENGSRSILEKKKKKKKKKKQKKNESLNLVFFTIY